MNLNFNKKYIFAFFLIASFLIAAGVMEGQDKKGTTRVTIKHADKWESFKRFGKNVQRLIGNVQAVQDGVIFNSDSAFLNTKTQDLTAYSDIHIQVNDSVNIYGDSLFYNGNTKIAHMYGDVRLTDPTTVLTTDYLIYNRNTQIASYTTGGKIVNKQNVLTSILGDYLTNFKEVHFKDSVVLVNPKYVMRSDTLNYNTQTEIVTFTGPTTVDGQDNHIFAKAGFYDTKTDMSRLSKDALVINKDNRLEGDSINYNALIGLGEVFKNVVIRDTANQLSIKGNFADYQKLLGYAFVTDSAFAVAVDNGDSLFLHADTLYTIFDTAQQVKKVHAYPNVRFYRKDFQGVCDSLIYSAADSNIVFYREPILWSEKNQMTSPDSIRFTMANGKLDSLLIYNDAFIVSRDSTDTFNQIRGKNMIGNFKDNDLRKVRVIGNAQTLYFLRDEDHFLQGIDKSASSDMTILFQNNQLKSITYDRKPDGTTYTEEDLERPDLFLKGFKWYGKLRPVDRHDIFRETDRSLYQDSRSNFQPIPSDTIAVIDTSLPDAEQLSKEEEKLQMNQTLQNDSIPDTSNTPIDSLLTK